ncbi:MFS transporter [Zoogloea sp.]|uniref:MFS transporter n=1 Tax=Zoogloea sp. TaxID=49181 RepID=UPI0035B354E8
MSAPAARNANTSTNTVSPLRHRLIMGLVTGTLFMEILDGSVIVTALPAMAAAFGIAPVALNLGVSAYLLALGVFIPASGWLADRVGARRLLLPAIALFTFSSVLCAQVSSAHAFILLRILQGLAGAMMVPVGRLLILQITPRDQLMAAMTALVWPALVAPVVGPPLGAFITAHLGWRWIFYLNLPLGLLALGLAWALVPPGRPADAVTRPFDLPGFLLCGGGMFGLLYGLEWVADDVSLAGALVLALGCVLLACAWRHLQQSRAPLVDLSTLEIATFRTAIRGGLLCRMGIGSAPFLLPLLFQVGFGYDVIRSGWLVLCMFAGNLGMKALSVQVLRRWGYRRAMLGNGLLAALALAGFGFLTPTTPLPIMVALLFVSGLTRSMQFTVLGTLAYADMPKPRMSHANSLFNTTGQLAMAGAIALGALGLRLGAWLAPHLGWEGSAAAYPMAFGLAACVTLLGLVDALRLPPGAGDHFISRG